MTFDASNRKDVRKAEKAAEQAIARRRTFLKRIMQDLDGREYMYDFLTRCHIFNTPFIAGQPDLTAFACGEQNMGMQTFADLQLACPVEYTMMLSEAMQKEIINDRYDGNNRKPSEPAGTTEDSGRDDSGFDNQSSDDFGQEPDGQVH